MTSLHKTVRRESCRSFEAGKFLTVRVNDPRDLRKFIANLKIAAQNSNDTGGLYAAFLKLADGRTLQVEIGLPTIIDKKLRDQL